VPDLSVDLAGLRLANPTLTCSGTCGYAFEYADFMDLSRLGGFVTKSITRHERPGNEPARVVETRGGMLNAIGLANVGLDRFRAEKVPQLQRMPCPVIVNVADGLTFGTHPGRLRELVAEVKGVLPAKPLIVKLSPNVEDITATAAAAVAGGADVLSLVNTFTAMAVDVRTRRPRLANVTGGLSGPAVKPIALHLVSRVYRNVTKHSKTPIIGMGGVQTWQDAAEFVLAGAAAVAVGTALFIDPATPNRIADGLDAWLTQQGVDRLADLVGALELPGDEPRRTPDP